MINAKKQNLKKMISSCTFLDDASIKSWLGKSDDLSPEATGFAYSKFQSAKYSVENIYIKLALSNDPTNGDLLKELLSSIKQFKT